jgi:hypothetical protein
MDLNSIVAGLILMLICPLLIWLSLVLARKKKNSEDKYHTFFWIGLLCGLAGLWLLFGKTFL